MPVKNRVLKTITAQNEFTDALTVQEGKSFLIIIEGTWTATLTLQERSGEDDSWRDVTFQDGTLIQFENNVNTSTNIQNHLQQMQFRLGVKTGDFTSGSINCEMRSV